MRLKWIEEHEFERIARWNWQRVSFPFDERPTFLQNIPATVVCTIAASGVLCGTQFYSNRVIPSGVLVGGYDLWRHAPDDPVRYNKDHYDVISLGVPGRLAVYGPSKDSEHWADNLPHWIDGIPIVSRY